MNLLIKRQNAIKSADYYELLNTIKSDSLEIRKTWPEPYNTKQGILLMPNFTDPDYEKANNEKIYLKCAAIRFLKNKKVYITCGKSHKACVENSKKYFSTMVSYERGFLTNTLEYIPALHASRVIKNYKFNDNHYNFYSQFELVFSTNLSVYNEQKVLLFSSPYIVIKNSKNHIMYEINLPPELSCEKKERPWLIDINLKKNIVTFTEKYKEFKFSAVQKIYCTLLKVTV